MRLIDLPYQRDSAAVFAPFAGEPWAVFLDSGHPRIDSGRYDIIAARPFKTLVTYGPETVIAADNRKVSSIGDPFLLVQEALGDIDKNFTALPFCGGAIGYFGYDLGRRLECLPERARDDIAVPDMAVGIYDWAVVVDHQMRRTCLVASGHDSQTDGVWNELVAMLSRSASCTAANFCACGEMRSNFDRTNYAHAFQKIKDYIWAGDCYQVNLAQRFSVDVEGNPWSIYEKLRAVNPAPFAGYLNMPPAVLLSCSPERFISLQGRRVETKPIKGTIRRSVFAYEDKALAEQLLESDKDRAENLMIVDLLRNDLGKCCETGSVAVPKLFSLESFATVHHLVSTVTGQLAAGRHALQLLRACFPGGSITGAPKLRAMQIIEELEPCRRKVYCGSVAYVGFDGNMDSNIVIRTLLHHDDRIYCWAGGGIVADSNVDSEYQECFAKAGVILKVFEDEGGRRVGHQSWR